MFKILQETTSDWPGLVTTNPVGRALRAGSHTGLWFAWLVLSPRRGFPQLKTGLTALDHSLSPEHKTKCEKEENEIFYSSTT